MSDLYRRPEIPWDKRSDTWKKVYKILREDATIAAIDGTGLSNTSLDDGLWERLVDRVLDTIDKGHDDRLIIDDAYLTRYGDDYRYH